MSSYEHFVLRTEDAVNVKNALKSDLVLPPISSNTCRQLRIDHVDFFNNFDNITAANNKFYMTVYDSVGGLTFDVYWTLPVGLYTVDTLCATITTLMKTTDPIRVTTGTPLTGLNFNNATTLVSSVNFKYIKFFINTNTTSLTLYFKKLYADVGSINAMLGLFEDATFTEISGVLTDDHHYTTTHPYNVVRVRNLFICSNALSKFETSYKVTKDKFPSLFLTIPVTSMLNERMVYKPKKCVNYPPKTSQFIDLQIRDDFGELVDFRNNFMAIKGTMYSTGETLV